MKNSLSKRKSKRDLYFEEAQSLFISGLGLNEIAKVLSVSRKTLKGWQDFGQWERKRELVDSHPKLISETLKGLVKQKVKALLAKEDDLNVTKIDELNKLISLIERMAEQSWDERAAIVEVMSLFGNFARRQVGEKQNLKTLADLMEKFFREMEGR